MQTDHSAGVALAPRGNEWRRGIQVVQHPQGHPHHLDVRRPAGPSAARRVRVVMGHAGHGATAAVEAVAGLLFLLLLATAVVLLFLAVVLHLAEGGLELGRLRGTAQPLILGSGLLRAPHEAHELAHRPTLELLLLDKCVRDPHGVGRQRVGERSQSPHILASAGGDVVVDDELAVRGGLAWRRGTPGDGHDRHPRILGGLDNGVRRSCRGWTGHEDYGGPGPAAEGKALQQLRHALLLGVVVAAHEAALVHRPAHHLRRGLAP
mmetsp:Transcript_55803/g.143798  ORF Transcript_55803/g.143798 Transcript_55803/m.143798 type:complete len:264 (-) Transcript_55803:288-1079(-)